MGPRPFLLLALLVASALPGVAEATLSETVCVLDQAEARPPGALVDNILAGALSDVASPADVPQRTDSAPTAFERPSIATVNDTDRDSTSGASVDHADGLLVSRTGAPNLRPRAMLASLPMERRVPMKRICVAQSRRGPLVFHTPRG